MEVRFLNNKQNIFLTYLQVEKYADGIFSIHNWSLLFRSTTTYSIVSAAQCPPRALASERRSNTGVRLARPFRRQEDTAAAAASLGVSPWNLFYSLSRTTAVAEDRLGRGGRTRGTRARWGTHEIFLTRDAKQNTFFFFRKFLML